MKIDALATERHFIDHVAPIYLALPEEIRGKFYTLPKLASHAHLRGIARVSTRMDQPAGVTLVSSYGDVRKTQGKLIYIEHGIGQAYRNRPLHGSYAGGVGRERVGLFLVPSDRVGTLWGEAYPGAQVEVIGEPRLDPWHSRPKISVSCSAMPTIAISFHWNADSVAPEAMWAFPHYSRHLAELNKLGVEVIGHGHPRAIAGLAAWYKRAGIELVKDFHEVLDRADLYICDNSSSLYEFASTRRPVVVLNAPWYRRNVEHGVRFWEYADVGPQVDGPDQLLDAIRLAWEEQPTQVLRREVVSDALLAYRDGTSTERAVRAIKDWVQA